MPPISKIISQISNRELLGGGAALFFWRVSYVPSEPPPSISKVRGAILR